MPAPTQGLTKSAAHSVRRSTVMGSSARGAPRQSAHAGRAIIAEQRAQRLQPGENQVGRGDARVQVEASPVDPGDGEAERLPAYHVGELRLP